MEDSLVINHIKEICKQRGWTYYRLAKEANIPHSSINTMLNHQHIPTLNNLIKICNGFNITLAQFFFTMEQASTEQEELLKLWYTLDNNSRKMALIYMCGLANTEVPDFINNTSTMET